MDFFGPFGLKTLAVIEVTVGGNSILGQSLSGYDGVSRHPYFY